MATLSWGRLTGTRKLSRSDYGSEEEFEAAVGLLRATQEIRTSQAKFSPPLVAACVAVLLFELRGETNARLPMLVFGVSLVGSLVLRAIVARTIKPRVPHASVAELASFENRLFWSGIFASAAMGSGFWLVATSSTAIFDITLACCLFAMGTMINVSVEERPFYFSIVANMGQGIVFHLTPGPNFDPFFGFLMVTLLALLAGFGRVNSRRFAESFAMRQQNARLVQQLDAEKRTVELALSQARDAAKENQRFLAAAGHDLRQPLHAMSLYLGPLLSQVEGSPSERIVQRLIESTDLLAKELNDMLDLSRLDAGAVRVELREFDLQAFLMAVVEDVRPQAEEKGLTLEVVLPASRTHTDPTLLDRVVRNLLSNAINYTKAGEVRLSVLADGVRLRIDVEDTGPGIAEEDSARIFDDFVQLQNPNRSRARGLGLGLASVRRINQLMKFDLQLESTIGRGSKFTFWVPAIEVKQAQPQSSRPHHERPQVGDQEEERISVWAVEDDPAVADALEVQLRSLGCLVELLVSMEEVQKLSRRTPWPDLALIDDMLEGSQSGLEVAEWMRRSIPEDLARDTQIVMLTGNSDGARLDEIRRSGFRLLQKPLRLGELESVLGARRKMSGDVP